MFTGRLIELAQRKQSLLSRAETERGMLASGFDALRQPLAIADKGVATVAYLKAHPLILLAGVVVVMLARPRGAMRWLSRGFVVWKAWRALGAWSQRLRY